MISKDRQTQNKKTLQEQQEYKSLYSHKICKQIFAQTQKIFEAQDQRQEQINFHQGHQKPMFKLSNQEHGEHEESEDKVKFCADIGVISNGIMKKTPKSKISNEERLAIQKTLAQKFITIGFGYLINMKAVKKRHKIAIQDTFYHCLMGGIVRRTFRILQNFLIVDCKQQNIKPLAHHQVTYIRSPMLQCSKWLAKSQLQTFYKFIMRSYELKQVIITVDQAFKLYGQFVQSTKNVNEIYHIIKRKNRSKNDLKNNQGLVFTYAPSSLVNINRIDYRFNITKKFEDV